MSTNGSEKIGRRKSNHEFEPLKGMTISPVTFIREPPPHPHIPGLARYIAGTGRKKSNKFERDFQEKYQCISAVTAAGFQE